MVGLVKAAFAAVAVCGMIAAGHGVARAEKGRGGADDGAGHERHSSSHEGHSSMSHEGHGSASSVPGVVVREARVGGFALTYRVYDWAERNAMMKGMEGHEMHGMDSSGRSTNHLMVFATGPDGREVSGGKVGFVVVAPDKSEFKTLTMGMSGGYGADVPLKTPGLHTVRTKAVFGDRTVQDEFTYAVK